jgi:hypothetical protein
MTGDSSSPDAETEGDLLEFGGHPIGWARRRVGSEPGSGPGADRLARLARQLSRVNASTIEAALIALVIGLVIGFVGGHVTAKPKHQQHSTEPGKVTLTPVFMQAPLADNGGRCAVQVGRNLELGIELVNQSRSPVLVERITPVFALGGFRPTASGAGPCGALPGSQYVQPAAILPGATEWVAATLKVLVHCPQARPVGFKLRYSQSGKTGTTIFNAFPDLGQIPYRGCTTPSG